MAQQSPNVFDLYQGAVDEMLPILSVVRADQLTAGPRALIGTSKI